MAAAQQGYQQILWLYGEDHQVTEVGTVSHIEGRLIRKATDKVLVQ